MDAFLRRFREGDEEPIENLVESVFSNFLEGRYWSWKYRENPYFDPRLVALAEVNGEVVGCNHWLLRDLKISGSIVGKTVLAADVAVKPDYRGKGLGSSLLRFLRSSEVVKRGDAALIYMFADPELAKRFHSPTAGYIPAPDGTVQYMKVLSWRKVKRNVDSLNEEIRDGRLGRRLPKHDLSVLFKISAAPKLFIRVEKDRLVVDEGEGLDDDADVVVSGSLSIFNRIKMSKRRRWSFLKALLTGKLRIKVRLNKILRIFDALWIFEEVFGKKMT